MNVFLPKPGWWYERFEGDVGNGSYNSIAESLGYAPSQLYQLFLFEKPGGLEGIGLLPLTQKVVFVLTTGTVSKLRSSQVERQLKKVDWGFEYRPDEVENILDQGIEEASWSVAFMRLLFPEMEEVEDQVYQYVKGGLYLVIKGNRLIDYFSVDGLSVHGKHWYELNPAIVNGWLGEGQLLHGDQEKAIDYVNLQAGAWASLPGGLDNEHVPDYTRKDGTVDFFMIWAKAGRQSVSLEDFRLRIGSKQAAKFEREGEAVVYRYGKLSYWFVNGKLVSVTE